MDDGAWYEDLFYLYDGNPSYNLGGIHGFLMHGVPPLQPENPTKAWYIHPDTET